MENEACYRKIIVLTVIFIGLLIFLCHFHFIFTAPLLMIRGFQTYQAWILRNFPRISNWASVSNYSKDMSRVTTFAPLRGNHETEPFKVYLNRLVAEDMKFNIYVNHRETWPFDEIVLYSRWLTCGSCLTTSPLPEHVMRQFSYT